MSVQTIHSTPPNGGVIEVVPANQIWHILYGHIIWNSTATGGNRWIRVQALTEDGHIAADAHAGAKQTSSVTREYALKQGITTATAFNDTDIEMGIPVDFILLPGWTLKVFDSAAIDANDTATIHVTYKQNSSSIYKR